MSSLVITILTIRCYIQSIRLDLGGETVPRYVTIQLPRGIL